MAGLPVSGLHVLRHTAAKLRRDVGESVESVSQFLDHSSLAVTTNLSPQTRRSARCRLAGRRQRYRRELAPEGRRSALTSTRLQSLHTSRFNPLALEVFMPGPIVRIATYARVSSDEQRDRHTVRNQRSALSRRLSSEPSLAVFRH